MEAAGDVRGALAAYRSAGAQGDKMALFDAGRLAVQSGKDPMAVRNGLLMLCDCANLESAGFYFAQKNSDAARMAALTELARAFENGVAVDQDSSIAGYLYQQAAEAESASGQWLAKNAGKRDYAEVSRRRGEGQKGVARMVALGYGGETYRWPEIADRLRPASSSARKGKRKDFEIVSMSFDVGNQDETIFEYKIPEGVEFTLAIDQAIRREMFSKVKQEYCARHPGADPADVRASATHYQKTGNHLSYVVAAFWLHPSELEYSDTTKHGVLRLRFDGKDILDAQTWARENLEELVNAQNVVLVSGRRPAENAKYKYGAIRSIDDGARLEIHFATIE